MTYLELVNAVLRRLRVDQVTSVAETDYSLLIGDFINDAKTSVEVAWDWSALRTTLVINTTNAVSNYTLLNSNNNVKVFDVINDTANAFMKYRPSDWMRNAFLNNEPATGVPFYYTLNGLNASGDTLVDVYPIPDGPYALNFNVILRNPELVLDTDSLLIPSKPIIHLALALAARERGETGGTTTPEYFVVADNYLSDAIAMDANKYPEELIFREV
jgi:hypothetical protein